MKLFGRTSEEEKETKILVTCGAHELVVRETRALVKSLGEVEKCLVQYVEGESFSSSFTLFPKKDLLKSCLSSCLCLQFAVQDEPHGFAWLLSSSSAKETIYDLK